MKKFIETKIVVAEPRKFDTQNRYRPRNLVIPEITLEGLEYLEQNSIMKKVANTAKGIKNMIPGM